MEQPHGSDIVMTCLIPIWPHLGKPVNFFRSQSLFVGRIFPVFYRNHPHLVTTGRQDEEMLLFGGGSGQQSIDGFARLGPVL